MNPIEQGALDRDWRIMMRARVEEIVRSARMVLDAEITQDCAQVGIETLMFDLDDGRTVLVEPRENSDGELALMFVDPETEEICGVDGIVEGLVP